MGIWTGCEAGMCRVEMSALSAMHNQPSLQHPLCTY